MVSGKTLLHYLTYDLLNVAYLVIQKYVTKQRELRKQSCLHLKHVV